MLFGFNCKLKAAVETYNITVSKQCLSFCVVKRVKHETKKLFKAE